MLYIQSPKDNFDVLNVSTSMNELNTDLMGKIESPEVIEKTYDDLFKKPIYIEQERVLPMDYRDFGFRVNFKEEKILFPKSFIL